MIGAQREVDPETSETSSYCSSRNPDSEDSDDGVEKLPVDIELSDELELVLELLAV